MKYRVEVELNFDVEQDAIDFLNSIEALKTKANADVKPKDGFPMATVCRYHKCYHDDTVPIPCGNYVNVDFKAAPVVHVTEATIEP